METKGGTKKKKKSREIENKGGTKNKEGDSSIKIFLYDDCVTLHALW